MSGSLDVIAAGEGNTLSLAATLILRVARPAGRNAMISGAVTATPTPLVPGFPAAPAVDNSPRRGGDRVRDCRAVLPS